MGSRGPRKKLSALSNLDGNPGKRAILDLGVEASGDVFVPDHLCEDAQGCIDVIRGSMPPNVYAKVDSFLLAAFATAWSLHKRAAHEINAPDFQHLIENKPNGWIRILNGQAEKLASLGDRLGLDPKSRAAIKLPSADKPRSKFDGLIGQPASSPSSRH